MFDLTWVADPNAWIALATLTVMEIVLGIDNIIFIAVLADKLPEKQRDSARRLGLIFAMATRILLLFCIAWMIRLQEPIIDFYSIALSGRAVTLPATLPPGSDIFDQDPLPRLVLNFEEQGIDETFILVVVDYIPDGVKTHNDLNSTIGWGIGNIAQDNIPSAANPRQESSFALALQWGLRTFRLGTEY